MQACIARLQHKRSLRILSCCQRKAPQPSPRVSKHLIREPPNTKRILIRAGLAYVECGSESAALGLKDLQGCDPSKHPSRDVQKHKPKFIVIFRRWDRRNNLLLHSLYYFVRIVIALALFRC